MTPEGKVKQFIDKRMKEWFPDVFRYCPPGIGHFGRNGMPDRMWIIKANESTSIVVAIEAKADVTCDATDLQIKTLRILAKQGAIAAVVKGKDESHMLRIRNEILRRIQLANEEPKSSTVQAPGRDD